MSDYIMQRGSQTVGEVKVEDVQKYLRNPETFNKQIRNTSVYLTNKHGILKDVLRTVKSIPTLKYNLSLSSDSEEGYTEEHEKLAQDFLKNIDVVQVIRDGLYEVAQQGTVVMCLRSNRYVQFLDIDDLVIETQRNGKWVVMYDLLALSSTVDPQLRRAKLANLPDEVSIKKFNQYKNKSDESIRYVELKNCEVINIDARRNSPWGLPITIGAWLAILQKEMIDNVEKSISSRLLKQILVLQADWLDKDKSSYADRETVKPYFDEVSKIVQKQSADKHSANKSGVGTLTLPHFLKLDALQVDTTMFKSELYDKINNDIYANLGISESMISGKGGTYASANINETKFFSIVFTIVEQFETAINNYLNTVMPEGVSCTIKFDRSTILDKELDIARKQELFMQTNIKTPYLESVLGVPMHEIVALREKEKEQGFDDLFTPAQNAYTTSGSDLKNNDSVDNDNTEKTKDHDGNNTPSPSD